MATRVGYGCLWLQELGMTTMVGYGYRVIVWLQGLGMAKWGRFSYKGFEAAQFLFWEYFVSYFRYRIFAVYVIRFVLSYQSLLWLSGVIGPAFRVGSIYT
jgi:hypothetical protein